MQHPLAEQRKASLAISLSFDQFQPIITFTRIRLASLMSLNINPVPQLPHRLAFNLQRVLKFAAIVLDDLF